MKKFDNVIDTAYYKREEKSLTKVVCDMCHKEIMVGRYKSDDAAYIRVHTWHNDWGNDSCESHRYYDFCKDCASEFVANYIAKSYGTEELNLSIEYASVNSKENSSLVRVNKEDIV